MEASGCEIGLGGHIAPAQQKRQQESQEASVTVVPIAPTVASDSPSSNPVACAVPKKPTPKRAIVLTGVPTPALPPRPAFSSELEQYQVHGAEGSKLNSQVQAYLSSLRQDYERQLREYDMLKKVVQEDTYFAGVVVDELDALDEDPFTLDSFENLMRLHASKGKDFIVARVTTQDPNDEAKLYHSYYGAHQINKVLFRTQPEEGLLHRMKARNPLNNMLVVGDVHYYTISAKDVNAIKPLPAVSSSSSSISSHSSRMSRCSKLAAQAIASQLTSARSSPILGGDMSLFSRSSDIESPVSVVSPSMATSIHEGEQEDGSQIADGSKSESSDSSHSSRPRRGSFGSVMSSTLPVTPTGPQSTFQPGRPSRLRQTVETVDSESGTRQCDNDSIVPNHASPSTDVQSRPRHGDIGDTIYSPTSPPTRHRSQTQQLGQSPLFQNLMNGRVRSRSNTITSVGSDKSASSILSDKSDLSHVTNCSTVTSINSDMSDCSNTAIFSPSEASVASPVATSPAEQIESVTYRFQYLASDDDFLLRSAIRLIFKTNALEAWDAILFTISNNALRGYSGPEGEHITITPQHPEPPLESAVQGITQGSQVPALETSQNDASAGRLATGTGHGDSAIGVQTNDSTASQNSTGNEVENRAEPRDGSGASQSLPSIPSALNALRPSIPSSSPSSSSSPSLSSTLSSPPSLTLTTATAPRTGMTLLKHDSGHASDAQMYPEASFVAGTSSGSHSRADLSEVRRLSSTGLATSASEGALPIDLHMDAQQRRSSGRKIRQVLSRLFAM